MFLRNDSAFQAAAGALVALANDLDVPHFAVGMMALLHRIEDGHTVLIPYSLGAEGFQTRLPLELTRLDDGYYVTATATGSASRLLGARMAAINGVPVNEIMRRFGAVQPRDNSAWTARWGPLALTVPGLLVGLDVVRETAEGVVAVTADAEGAKITVDLRPRSAEGQALTPIKRTPTPPERWAEAEPSRNFVRVLGEHRALYISLGTMGDTEGRSFSEFERLWMDGMARVEIDRMIIDLRDNGGGNNMLPEPMRRRIVRSRFNRPGHLFVLIGPRTFSAAQNLATRIERETDALFVGEPTGGRPNHFGDPQVVRGPATGGTYLISTLRWQDSPPFDQRPWILPDIPAPSMWADYLSGRDPALEVALRQVAQEAEDPARWAEPWNRPSQRREWRFFWER